MQRDATQSGSLTGASLRSRRSAVVRGLASWVLVSWVLAMMIGCREDRPPQERTTRPAIQPIQPIQPPHASVGQPLAPEDIQGLFRQTGAGVAPEGCARNRTWHGRAADRCAHISAANGRTDCISLVLGALVCRAAEGRSNAGAVSLAARRDRQEDRSAGISRRPRTRSHRQAAGGGAFPAATRGKDTASRAGRSVSRRPGTLWRGRRFATPVQVDQFARLC